MNITQVNKIKIFETFAGIGAQHQAIRKNKRLKNQFEVVKISDWDARVIISYALIHHKSKFFQQLKKVQKLKESQIDDYLKKYNFSLNSKTKANILRKDLLFKQVLMSANKVSNNLPDICQVGVNEIEEIDLLTYSFPCQGLSIANMGRDLGIDDKKSTSSLIYQIQRLLKEADQNKKVLPKYLLMENVKNLLSKRHKDSYQKWISFLSKMGYKTFSVVVDATNFRSVQKRKRLVAISIRKDVCPKKWLRWNGIKFEEKIFLRYQNALSQNERKKKINSILKYKLQYQDEYQNALIPKTPSRQMMIENNTNLSKSQKKFNYYFKTLTTKQDRNPNLGFVDFKKNVSPKFFDKRFITPREAFLIMGFQNPDFNRLKNYWKNGILTKEALYRQAGNSIVVNILNAIFEFFGDLEKGAYARYW